MLKVEKKPITKGANLLVNISLWFTANFIIFIPLRTSLQYLRWAINEQIKGKKTSHVELGASKSPKAFVVP
jgi:hypothetical protein